MRSGWTPLGWMLLFLFIAAIGAWAGEGRAEDRGGAVREMARIVLHMEHYPVDAEKARLRAMAEDAGRPRYERVLAAAVANIRHTPAARDQYQLRRLVDDRAVPEPARELARAVLDFQHRPGEAAAARLRGILGE